MQVIVQPDHTPLRPIAAVALDHLATQRKPFAPIGLDEKASFITVHGRLDDLHALDDVRLVDRGH